MLDRISNLAIETALKSTHRHRVGAVIFRKKTIISSKENKKFRFVKNLHPKYTKYPNSLHAEVASILAARKNLNNCEILVVRINKKNCLRLSKPCKYCMMYIQEVGIKKVYYSDNDGKIKTMRVRN